MHINKSKIQLISSFSDHDICYYPNFVKTKFVSSREPLMHSELTTGFFSNNLQKSQRSNVTATIPGMPPVFNETKSSERIFLSGYGFFHRKHCILIGRPI